jgi:hypothetical protein
MCQTQSGTCFTTSTFVRKVFVAIPGIPIQQRRYATITNNNHRCLVLGRHRFSSSHNQVTLVTIIETLYHHGQPCSRPTPAWRRREKLTQLDICPFNPPTCTDPFAVHYARNFIWQVTGLRRGGFCSNQSLTTLYSDASY